MEANDAVFFLQKISFKLKGKTNLRLEESIMEPADMFFLLFQKIIFKLKWKTSGLSNVSLRLQVNNTMVFLILCIQQAS